MDCFQQNKFSKQESEQALHKAAVFGHLEIVEFLVANGVDPREPDAYPTSTVYLCSLRKLEHIISFYEKKYGIRSLPSMQKQNHAVLSSMIEYQTLLKIKDEKYCENGLTLLHLACGFENGFELVDRLVKSKKIDINSRNNESI